MSSNGIAGPGGKMTVNLDGKLALQATDVGGPTSPSRAS